ncbi:MAG TPA: hypothetical protein DEA96_15140 [Leptospiraceae bacterium]|nr:hypothetical protein [Spirochaetaceae bacterium]HBS06302.1 hypothetical protein [Leptospiraceae bacterium]|tara:strand:+ start:18593 stop:19099 length:507 start_codon:yes stop_codon:yes gene_type:complete
MLKETDQKQARWRYYIDRSFQNQFIVRFSLVVVLVMVFTIGALWLLKENAFGLVPDNSGVLWSTDSAAALNCTYPDGGAVDLPAPVKPYDAFELYWKPIVFTSILNLVIIVIFSLFYSHSMAGPIHSIKNSLRDLKDGEPARPIRIRKGDQFQELASLLNEVIEKRVK